MKQTSSAKKDLWFRFIYNFLAPPFRLFSHTFCRYTTKPIRPEGQFIVVCNHLTERDFLMVAHLVRHHMYIVVSEHLFRGGGFFGWFVRNVLNPISRSKGAVDLASVSEMLRRIRQGRNLMLFPEGHRSADGVTLESEKSIGNLIRKSNCTLITMKITGGYFCEPRWAKFNRRGPMTAGIVGVYDAETIRSLSAEEVADLVNRDIYEDAYARQLEEPKPYKGKNLAEGLENHLFLCPACKGVSTLRSQGNHFRCGCGLAAEYDEYAMLSGEGLPFTTVRQWTLWQQEEFMRMAEQREGALTRDENATLFELTKDHQRIPLTQGLLWADRDALHLDDRTFPFDQIRSTAFLNRGNTLFFQTWDGYYELYGPGICQLKYQLLWNRCHNSQAAGRKRRP